MRLIAYQRFKVPGSKFKVGGGDVELGTLNLERY